MGVGSSLSTATAFIINANLSGFHCGCLCTLTECAESLITAVLHCDAVQKKKKKHEETLRKI